MYTMPSPSDTLPRLCLNLHDELYLINLEQTLYFMADDHYTHVFYANGARFMLPFGLSRIEERFIQLGNHVAHPFRRLGRKYIVNTLAIHSINITKQTLTLLASGDKEGKTQCLQISKPVLRDLLQSIPADYRFDENNGE